MTLFKNEIFANIIKFRGGHIQLEDEREIDTGKTPYENGGREWRDASISHRALRICSSTKS